MPTVLEALLLGRQYHQAGDLARAVQIYQEILRADGGNFDAWYLLASANQSLGRLGEAEGCYRQAARLRPDHAETYNGLGIVLAQLGRPAEAVDCFRRVLLIQPGHAQAHNNLGNVLRDLGRFAEAEASCRQAIQLKPDYPEAYSNLGNALKDQGRFDEAVASLREALRLRPNYARAYNNLGAALAAQRKFDEAIRCYQEALRLQPDFFQAHNNLGVVHAELRQFDQAAACYQQALRHRPDFADAYNNLGIAFQDVWKLDEALACYQQALRYRPGFADAHNQIAMVHMAQGRVEEAVASYRRSLELKPDEARVHSNLLLCLNYLPDLSPDDLYAEHLRWDQRHGQVERLGPLPGHDRNPDRRLRVGYLSPDLRKHAVAYFFAPILANHDPGQVEAFCYAQVPNPDAVTDRLRALAHGWRSIAHPSEAEVVEQIRADRIDILVDLAGHAGNKRLRVFAHKPAPVQVTYLGYPNTTGLKAMDYRLTDAVADPPGEPVRYSEELVRLPGSFCCYQPPEEAPEVSPLPALRNGYFTFGSVHGLAKLNRRVFELWAHALHAAPSARLYVLRDVLKGRTKDEIAGAMQQHGIPLERVELRHDADSHPSYLRRYDDIDLCLDAFPFCGHTTMCEALWMGVPVVTWYGNRFAGRMAASVLTVLGLPEFIARTPEQYVELAARWATDLEGLARLRGRLREQMRTSPLCDGQAFTRGLEAAYRGLWRRWCAVTAE
jgi:predicted O-linked N-acetylglucosamine transferase (SPINDLY family)